MLSVEEHLTVGGGISQTNGFIVIWLDEARGVMTIWKCGALSARESDGERVRNKVNRCSPPPKLRACTAFLTISLLQTMTMLFTIITITLSFCAYELPVWNFAILEGSNGDYMKALGKNKG